MSLDHFILHFLQGPISNSVLDFFCLWVRKSWIWSPLYLGVLVFWLRNKRDFFWPLLLGALVVFAAADFTSASLIKPLIARLRPCQVDGLLLRKMVVCGTGFSFPSTHATNHLPWLSFFSTSLENRGFGSFGLDSLASAKCTWAFITSRMF